MTYFVPFIVFGLLMALCYAQIGRKRTPGEGAALVLALVATLPVLDGTLLLVKEYDRLQDGRVVAGVVTGRLSSTGAEGSRTIGGHRYWRSSERVPTVLTAEGFRFHDVVARLILTGSPDAWIVEYRYPCPSRECWRRESVSRARWSALQIGQTVAVRRANGRDDSGRLDANPPWTLAAAKLAIGGVLAGLAALVSGRLFRRRTKLVAAPAVVTSVEPVQAGGKVHWRVGFAYFSADGTPHENADEVYVPGLQPGDACTAVYPVDQPDLGTLRLVS